MGKTDLNFFSERGNIETQDLWLCLWAHLFFQLGAICLQQVSGL